jgi:hypothetical protein
MDPMLLIGFAAAGFVTWFVVAALDGARPRMSLLEPRKPTASGHDALLATLRTVSGQAARVEPYTRGDEDHGVCLVVEGLCGAVVLRRALPDGPLGDVDTHDTGDPEFDKAIEALGSEAHACSLLTAETRKALLQFLVGSVRIGDVSLSAGELSVEVPTGGFAKEHPGLPQAAHAVGELSRRLVSVEPIRQRLASNARHDPVAGVRLKNLFAIVHLLPGDPFTLEELRAATKDHDPEVRLRAAMKLGPEARDVLHALVADEAVGDDIATQAINRLGGAFRLEEAVAQVDRACRDRAHGPRRPGTLRACIELLARHPAAEATLEATLVEALEIRSESVSLAAASALGSIGSSAAVLSLKEAAERHGGAFASAARQAIAEIQSRVTGSPGGLSLAEGESGQLSLSDDVGGRVSLPPPAPQDTGGAGDVDS